MAAESPSADAGNGVSVGRIVCRRWGWCGASSEPSADAAGCVSVSRTVCRRWLLSERRWRVDGAHCDGLVPSEGLLRSDIWLGGTLDGSRPRFRCYSCGAYRGCFPIIVTGERIRRGSSNASQAPRRHSDERNHERADQRTAAPASRHASRCAIRVTCVIAASYIAELGAVRGCDGGARYRRRLDAAV